jgi:lactoylglutathione lyase
MKILFPALRVSDLDTSLAFYTSVGLEAVGHVTGDAGIRMAMLAWPWDDEVSLELVDRTDGGPVVPGGFDHLAIQVDDLEATRRDLVAAGLDVGVVETPGGRDGPRTVAVVDPDGHRLELVQWPVGHPVAMTRGDFDLVTPFRAHAPSGTSKKETQR